MIPKETVGTDQAAQNVFSDIIMIPDCYVPDQDVSIRVPYVIAFQTTYPSRGAFTFGVIDKSSGITTSGTQVGG